MSKRKIGIPPEMVPGEKEPLPRFSIPPEMVPGLPDNPLTAIEVGPPALPQIVPGTGLEDTIPGFPQPQLQQPAPSSPTQGKEII